MVVESSEREEEVEIVVDVVGRGVAVAIVDLVFDAPLQRHLLQLQGPDLHLLVGNKPTTALTASTPRVARHPNNICFIWRLAMGMSIVGHGRISKQALGLCLFMVLMDVTVVVEGASGDRRVGILCVLVSKWDGEVLVFSVVAAVIRIDEPWHGITGHGVLISGLGSYSLAASSSLHDKQGEVLVDANGLTKVLMRLRSQPLCCS